MKRKPVVFQIQGTGYESISPKYYSVPEKFLEQARDELKRLTDEGIIERSFETFSSPAFIIAKKDGTVRLVVDYREINQHICDDINIIPNIREVYQRIGQAKYFTKIDLKNGFNQIAIDDNSKRLTTFTMLGNQYRYRRIPFGIKVGPKLFQKAINDILEGIRNVFIYIDDIIIYTEDYTTHNTILNEVLKRLRKYEVRINFDKTHILGNQVEVLGSIVQYGKLMPDVSKLKTKLQSIQCKTKKDIQRIIGLLNWYREYIPNFSNKLRTVTELLKTKGEKIHWTEEHTKTITKIRDELTAETYLGLPDYRKEFILQTDASDMGIGAVLLQKHGIIGYYSKKLNDTEKNYSIVEKEMLAIIRGLEHFRGIVLGYHIIIFTDNTNCIHQPTKPRMKRWKILLNEYNFQLKSIKGEENSMADTLSRCFITHTKKEINITNEEQTYIDELDRFTYKNNVMDEDKRKTWLLDGRGRVCIRDTQQIPFIKYMHEKAQHTGIITLYNTIKDVFFIKNIKRAINIVVHNCTKCIEYKSNIARADSQYKIRAAAPFKKISSDIYGPFDTTNYITKQDVEKGYFITITDLYTRFTQISFTTTIQGADVVKSLEKWLSRFETPKTIISDNGTQYLSKEVKEFLKEKDINHLVTPIYHPQSNGISERINGTLSEILSMNSGESMEEIVKRATERLNYNYKRCIGGSPFQYINQYNRFDPFKRKREVIIPEQTSSGTDNVFSNKQKRLAVGMSVYLKNFNAGKTDQKYKGPYVIESIGNRKLWCKLRGMNSWVHINHLKF
ncbi:Retrovirus-related Pol polyprotein from transposon 17.6 [Nosema granulosis]|uniref:Retrovirus-related Pol polyprotein from transposon 17.6 n=1 Tax=Nosema granulosis TaxID=83296 RepID=A0A9P6GZ13_9MICR|nr:Retrovirus-related Pol polyprotein from transposon 17.6 [Nosema granulosis]